MDFHRARLHQAKTALLVLVEHQLTSHPSLLPFHPFSFHPINIEPLHPLIPLKSPSSPRQADNTKNSLNIRDRVPESVVGRKRSTFLKLPSSSTNPPLYTRNLLNPDCTLYAFIFSPSPPPPTKNQPPPFPHPFPIPHPISQPHTIPSIETPNGNLRFRMPSLRLGVGSWAGVAS